MGGGNAGGNAFDKALAPVWEAIAKIKDSRSPTSGPGAAVTDYMPTFVATTAPPTLCRIWTMDWPYIQNTIAVMIGPVRLIPGTDFTAAGTVFTLTIGNWPSGPDSQPMTVLHANRIA